MSDATEPNEASDTPPVFTYPCPLRYRLSCPNRHNLNEALAFAIDVGLQAECLPDGSYRLNGPLASVQKVIEWIEHFKPAGPVCVTVERPPESSLVKFTVAPRTAPVRSATIHSAKDYARLVAFAVDAGLSVTCVGLHRYAVRGATRDQVRWLAAALEITTAQALERMGLNEAQAAAEDSGPPPITVNLPTRETVSEVERDREGNIRSVRQIERTAR